ncbi:hypothetical protein WICPIJ_001578 [Wickerhamomyces pijperi]|uniref:BZIP domain-containing protein n=1 Tax=Wickerhamomyces pijperi TaxID=599730 RepID=A0A9P8TPS6_WICPI|nr:hypothetical protein WICPIJ_001578 [Wickerhamomyces pijperi]
MSETAAAIPTNFKTALPPRKRAKTKEEKEQRRIERILRNRKAAHASREKKRRHVEFLESYVNDMESQLELYKSLNAKLLDQFYKAGEDSNVDSLVAKVQSLPDLSEKKLAHTTSNSADDEEDEDEEEQEQEQDQEDEVATKGRKANKSMGLPSAKRAKTSAIKIESSPVPTIPKFELPDTPESYQSPSSSSTHGFSRSNSIVSFQGDAASSQLIKKEDIEGDFSFFAPSSSDRDENRYSLDISNHDGTSLASSPLAVPDLDLELLPSSMGSNNTHEKLFTDDIDQLNQHACFTFDNEFVFDELRNPEAITPVLHTVCCQ